MKPVVALFLSLTMAGTALAQDRPGAGGTPLNGDALRERMIGAWVNGAGQCDPTVGRAVFFRSGLYVSFGPGNTSHPSRPGEAREVGLWHIEGNRVVFLEENYSAGHPDPQALPHPISIEIQRDMGDHLEGRSETPGGTSQFSLYPCPFPSP